MKKKSGHQRGSVLVTAILVIMVMLIMAIPFLIKLSAQSRSAERASRALSALNLAEAGAERAIWEMNRKFAPAGGGAIAVDANGGLVFGPESEPVGDRMGLFEGTITEDLNVIPHTRTLVSTGRMPFIGARTVDRTVQIVLEKYYRSIWDFGFFVDDFFRINTNFKLDSYDSRRGRYGSGNTGSWGYFGTNGHEADSWVIEHGSSTEIDGGVAAGSQTNPDDLDDVISISGAQGEYETMILQSEFELPSVNIFDLPPKDMFGHQGDQSLESWFTSDFKTEYLAFDDIAGLYNYQKQDFMPSSSDINSGYNNGNLSVRMNRTLNLTSADSGVYTSFNMARNSTVNIEGHVVMYVTGVDGSTGSFSNGGGKINIAEGGSLTVILGNSTFQLINNTYVNVYDSGPGLPADCIILGTDQFFYDGGDVGLMKWDNQVHISAAIYAPRAQIAATKGGSNIHLYGSAVVRSLDYLRGGAQIEFHYDEALGDLLTVEGGIPYWRVRSWQERIGQ